MADDDSDSDEARVLRPLQAAPGQWPGPSPGTNSPLDGLSPGSAYRIAFGPRTGQKVLMVQGAMSMDADFKQTLCADIDRFSLHAAVCCGADDRRPGVGTTVPLHHAPGFGQRPHVNQRRWASGAQAQDPLARRHHAPAAEAGHKQSSGFFCQLKGPSSARARPARLSPLEFMQRLAALVPRPRLHLIRFHGVLAPNARLRAQGVPQEPEPPAQAAPPAESEAPSAHHRPVQLSWWLPYWPKSLGGMSARKASSHWPRNTSDCRRR